MNKELLRRTARFIRQNPEAHDQSWWFIIEDSEATGYVFHTPDVRPEEALKHGLKLGCGTSACAAGSIVMLSEASPDELSDLAKKSWKYAAMELSGMPQDIADWLFGYNADEGVPDILEAIADGATYLELLDRFEGDLYGDEDFEPHYH